MRNTTEILQLTLVLWVCPEFSITRIRVDNNKFVIVPLQASSMRWAFKCQGSNNAKFTPSLLSVLSPLAF